MIFMKPLSILFYFLCFPAFMYSQNEPNTKSTRTYSPYGD